MILDTVWVVAGVFATIVLVYVGSRVVKSLKQDVLEDQPMPTAGFTLADLRQLHKERKISQEEFDRLKAKAISDALKTERPKKPL